MDENENQPNPQEEMNKKLAALEQQLTAQAKAMSESQAMNAELLKRVTQPQTTLEVDPELQKQMDAIMGPKLAQLEKAMATNAQAQHFERVKQLAAERGIVDPKITGKAEELLRQWFGQVNPSAIPANISNDALNFAIGEFYSVEKQKAEQSANERRQFNQMGQGVVQHKGVSGGGSGGGEKLPDLKGLNDSDAATALASYWEKKIGGNSF